MQVCGSLNGQLFGKNGWFSGFLFWSCLLGCIGSQASITIATVDGATERVGQSNSLAFNSQGNPAISYFANSADAGGGLADLRLATCTANCRTANPTFQVVTVDSAGNVGRHTNLRFNASGNPVIAYYSVTATDLKLATCTANCQSASPTFQIVTVDNAGSVGTHASMELNAAGNPIISYHDQTAGAIDVKMATCTANCQSANPTWQIVVVDSSGDVGFGQSLRLSSAGNPIIAYRDATNTALKLAVCTANCSSAAPTWQITTVDNSGDVGSFPVMALAPGDRPVIAYYDIVPSDFPGVRLATCLSGCDTATPSWQFFNLSARATNQLTLGLLVDPSGAPIIAYTDTVQNELQIGHCLSGCQSASPNFLFEPVGIPASTETVSMHLNARDVISMAVFADSALIGDLQFVTIPPAMFADGFED